MIALDEREGVALETKVMGEIQAAGEHEKYVRMFLDKARDKCSTLWQEELNTVTEENVDSKLSERIYKATVQTSEELKDEENLDLTNRQTIMIAIAMKMYVNKMRDHRTAIFSRRSHYLM